MEKLLASQMTHFALQPLPSAIGATSDVADTCFATLLEDGDGRGARPGGERAPSGQPRAGRVAGAEAEGQSERVTVAELALQGRLPAGEATPTPMVDSRLSGAPELDFGAVEQLLRSVAIQTLGERSAVQLEVGATKLDSLKISLRWDGQRLYARFDLSDAEQYRIVRSAVGELEESLRERGLPSEKVEVGLSSGAGREGREHRERRGEREGELGAPRGRCARTPPPLLRRLGGSGDLV